MKDGTTEHLPYEFAHLDDLMEAAGIDVLLATSKHNVQYLLGGYRFIFFSGDGRDRAQPVPARRRLREGRAGKDGLRGEQDGGDGARQPPLLDPAFLSRGLGDDRRDGEGGRDICAPWRRPRPG